MVKSMNRCLTYAEGVVTMVCPALLALALKKINWEGKVKEPVVPMVVLLIAGATLITGICPLLACCVSEKFEACVRWPRATRRLAAPFSSACLLALACWISLLIVPVKIVIPIGFVFGLAIVALSIFHLIATLTQTNREGDMGKEGRCNSASASEKKLADKTKEKQELKELELAEKTKELKEGVADKTNEKELHSKLDKSHELLSGVTGILFLGLEGLALEGLISTCHGIQDAIRTPMGISFTFCALGVYLMFLAMIHPLPVATTIRSIVRFTDILDLIMVVGTVAILATIMNKLMGLKGLLFLTSPFLIFLQFAYQLIPKFGKDPADLSSNSASSSSSGEQLPVTTRDTQGKGNQRENEADGDKKDEGNEQEFKAAPMGLTKVTFTGFLAVSVTSISSGSNNEWTDCFLLFAAAAIASGLSWRLLTHTPNEKMVGKEMVEAAIEAANVASFCTHFCIAVATVLFTVMAWEAANKMQATTCSHRN